LNPVTCSHRCTSAVHVASAACSVTMQAQLSQHRSPLEACPEAAKGLHVLYVFLVIHSLDSGGRVALRVPGGLLPAA
jgi:hypothetical protein